jgi:outer membrane receptor protein involved in Fe transport
VRPARGQRPPHAELQQRRLERHTRESRYGEYCSFTALVGQLPLDDQVYAADWLADAELAYRWRNYTFAAGAENLFDNSPDRNKVFRDGTTTFTTQSNNGMFTYPSQSPFGMNEGLCIRG